MTETIYCAQVPSDVLHLEFVQELNRRYQKNFSGWVLLDSNKDIWGESLYHGEVSGFFIGYLEYIAKKRTMIPFEMNTVTPYLNAYGLILYQETAAHLEKLCKLLPKDEYSLEELTL